MIWNNYVIFQKKILPSQFLQCILEIDVKEIFSNVCFALKSFFLTILVMVASEQTYSFSKLKLIKTYLRSTMGDKRLSSHAILFYQKNMISPEISIRQFYRTSFQKWKEVKLHYSVKYHFQIYCSKKNKLTYDYYAFFS